jgi:hypothetical protein
MADDHGAPIAYTVLAEGTPVFSSDGEQLGSVVRVLADGATDIFDGITIEAGGERFVDAPLIGDLYERAVLLKIAAEAARDLPHHTASPTVTRLSAADLDDDATGGPGGVRST